MFVRRQRKDIFMTLTFPSIGTMDDLMDNMGDNITYGNSSFNSTTLSPELQQLQLAYRITLPILLAIIMLSTGCTITLDDLKHQLIRPIGIIAGLLTQSMIFPLIAFGLAHGVQTTSNIAIGVLLLACTPIAGVSNVFTHWLEGDVSISVCVTILSYPLSMGTIALNMLIYSRFWTDEATTVPYSGIATGLATLAVPLVAGMLIKWKLPKVVSYAMKVGSVAGSLIPVLAVTCGSLLYPWIFQSSLQLWIAAAMLPFCGFLLGLLASAIVCLETKKRKAIMFTTASVNTGLCLTLIELTFPVEVKGQVTIFPMLYMIFWYLDVFIVVTVYKIYTKLCQNMPKERDEKMTEIYTIYENNSPETQDTKL